MTFLSLLLRSAGRPGYIIPVFFLLLSPQISAQEILPGPLSASLGGCYASLTADPLPSGNQASLGWLEGTSLSITHWQPFIIPEVSVSGLSASFHLFPGYLGISLNSWGIPGYHRTALWLSYGMMLGKNVSAGIGFRSGLISTAYGFFYQWQVSVSGGLIIRLNDKLTVGAHICDPFSVTAFKTPMTGLSSMISGGISYLLTSGLTLYLQASYSSAQKAGISLGTLWQVSQLIAFQAGYRSTPQTHSFGVTISPGKWIFQLAVPWVGGKGISPSAGITKKF